MQNCRTHDRRSDRGNGCLQWPAAALAGGLLSAIIAVSASAAEPTIGDVPYATIGDQHLLLDLYLPEEVSTAAPLIVWVHGGAWRSGSKDAVPITPLTQNGFAIASIEYRLTPVAPFPAQVHDIKSAIRFLRKHAEEYQVDPSRVTIAGASAGGHLAALVGVTYGHPQLEGDVGVRSGSSQVQAIVSYYGASNLRTILAQSTPHGLSVRVPALQLLLGGQPEEKPELARLASPVTHVDGNDPPLLLLHGDQDIQMPVNQSLELWVGYQKKGARTHLQIVHEAAHGGDVFYDHSHLRMVTEFLQKHLPASAPEAAP